MKRLILFFVMVVTLQLSQGQIFHMNWENQINKHKEIAAQMYEEASIYYSLFNEISKDTLKLKSILSQKDSTEYSAHYQFYSNGKIETIYLIGNKKSKLIYDSINRFMIKNSGKLGMVFHTYHNRQNIFTGCLLEIVNDNAEVLKRLECCDPFKIMVFRFNEYGNLGSFTIQNIDTVVFEGLYNEEGKPFLVRKQVVINNNSRFINIRYDKKKRIFSLLSYVNGFQDGLIKDGIDIFYYRKKVNRIEYYRNGTILYGVYYRTLYGKYHEIQTKIENSNISYTYYFNIFGQVTNIRVFDTKYKDQFVSNMRFRNGRIVDEIIMFKVGEGRTKKKYYYNRAHDIIKIENYYH